MCAWGGGLQQQPSAFATPSGRGGQGGSGSSSAGQEGVAVAVEEEEGELLQQQQQHAIGRPPFIGAAFPDLTPAHRITLEVVRCYPDFILGAAWDDAAARLGEKEVALLPQDAAALQRALRTVEGHGLRVAALQRMHAEAAVRRERVVEGEVMAGVMGERAARESAAVFEAANRHRPWVTEGKRYVGLGLEDRRVAAEARDSMVARSFAGFVGVQR